MPFILTCDNGNLLTLGPEAARIALIGHCRDVEHQLDRLTGNPWGKVRAEGGLLHWQPSYTPDTCPSKHWNDGNDVCADCGASLN
jgi:hypothetical protein